MRNACVILALFALTALAEEPFQWKLPPRFPKPVAPADNPMTTAKVNLGRRLFYDPRSVNGKESCGSCHRRFTKRLQDVGKFKIPTLRNIAVTAPYMHDGSVATLEDAIEHYAAGGRTIASGPNAGVGRNNPNKASNVEGFVLTAAEKKDLVAFLESLTDKEFLNNPDLANPWRR